MAKVAMTGEIVPWWRDPNDPKDYYVEINSDDGGFGIIVSEYSTFEAAAREFDRLTQLHPVTQMHPQMRVTMRHRAHIYRQYVPGRLRRETGRRD